MNFFQFKLTLKFRIYCAGGFIGYGRYNGHLSTAEFYCPENKIWTKIRSMGSPRSGLSIISYNGDVFAVGGCNGTRPDKGQVNTTEVRTKRL